MDFKKAYEDALERAKGICNENPSSSTAKFVCGQIFPEIKESEDERIRKALLKLVSNDKNNGYTEFYKAEGISCDDAISYLEKQKEQKSLDISAASEWLRDHVCNYVNSEYNEFHKCVEYDGSIDKERLVSDFEEAMQKEQQPADWSEEDKEIIYSLRSFLIQTEQSERYGSIQIAQIKKCLDWLKSLRPQPHWKPSEEQMEVLFKSNPVNLTPEELAIYQSVYNDLTKL